MNKVIAIEIVDKASGTLIRRVSVRDYPGNTDDVWRALDRTINQKREMLREVFEK